MISRFAGFKAIFFIFFLISLVFFVSSPIVHAQTTQPQFLITWGTTGSYIPPSYPGKALPTYGSNITASVELISNGKILDISDQTIYWYLNDNLIGGGTGVQQVTFPPTGEAPGSLTLKVELPNYSSGYLVHAITIPMVQPQVVIYAPYPNGDFSVNPVTVTALPYFFNASSPSNLSYAWSVNDQQGSNTENPQEAEITLPQGTQSGASIAVALSVTNSQDSTVANAAASLTYISSL